MELAAALPFRQTWCGEPHGGLPHRADRFFLFFFPCFFLFLFVFFVFFSFFFLLFLDFPALTEVKRIDSHRRAVPEMKLITSAPLGFMVAGRAPTG